MDFNIKDFNIENISSEQKKSILPSIPTFNPKSSSLHNDEISGLESIMNKNKIKKSPSSSLASSGKSLSGIKQNTPSSSLNIKPMSSSSLNNIGSNTFGTSNNMSSSLKTIDLGNSVNKLPSSNPTSINSMPKSNTVHSSSGSLNNSLNMNSLKNIDIGINKINTKPANINSLKVNSLDNELKSLNSNIDSDLNKLKSMSGPKLPSFNNSKPSLNNLSSDFKFNNSGLDFDKSYENIQKLKMQYISKINKLKSRKKFKEHGLKFSKEYTINSDLDEMRDEFNELQSQYDIRNSIQYQRRLFVTIASGIEIFSKSRFNPLDVDLDTFSSEINDDIDSYDDIFEDLHLKYIGEGSNLPPELRLLFKFGSTAAWIILQKNMLENSKMPDVNEILNNNPNLREQFKQATFKQFQNDNKGTENQFLGDLLGNTGGGPPLYNANNNGGSNNKTPKLDDIINSL